MKKTICKIATINFLIAMMLIKISSFAQCSLLVDFEENWNGSGIQQRTVIDQWGEWQVSGMVDDVAGNHYHSGVHSIRLRGNAGDNCYFQMNFDKPNGIGKISFYYASFSAHSGGIIAVYYSTNGGASWIKAGSVTAPHWGEGMLQANFPINIGGKVRVKVVREGSLSSNTSVNVDDFTLTEYTGPAVLPIFNPQGGCYTVLSPMNVSITSPNNAGATIYYTTDGTIPTTSSNIYTTPILIETTTTLKALAVDCTVPSAVTTATYAFPQGGTIGMLSWNFNVATGTLTISGEGEMPSYVETELPPWKCYDITAAIIENGVTTIGNYAFYDCQSLTSVTIPNSVTSIGKSAFYDCKNLEIITSYAIIPPVLGANAFLGVSGNIPVHIFCESYYSYMESPGWGNYFINIIKEGEPQKQQICMISVDENNRNEIVWKKQDEAVSYKIYRESIQSGQYDLMATINYSAPNIWIDTESNAKIRSYRYKIAAMNICESILSDAHKTMHLTINAGMNNSWNLIWTAYEGTAYSTYNIYRASGDTPGEFTLIGTMPSGNTSFSDFGAPAGYVYYIVEIMLNESCNLGKANSSIKSNMASNNPNASISENEMENIRIYPNPTTGKLKIENGELKIENVEIFDVFGKIQKIENWKTENIIDISHFSAGVYFVKISTETGEVTRKVVKE